MFAVNWRFNRFLLRNVLLQQLEYRAYYYMMFVSLFISFASDYLLLQYAYSDSRGSYLRANEVCTFVILGIMMRTSNSLWGGSFTFERQIRDGEFRRYLLQPVNFSHLFVVNALGEKVSTWALLALSYGILVLSVGSAVVVVPQWEFFIFFAIGISISWALFYLCVLCTFWLHETKFMITTLNYFSGLFAGSILPSDWLPLGIRTAIKFTPFPFMGDIPIRAALGKLSPQESATAFATGIAWIAGLSVINALLFRKGVRQYESFGG